MVDYFDLYLHYSGRKKKSVFTVNIGAMDGVLFDELHGYSSAYGFKGLFVEPIPYLFEKLKKNISSENFFENSCISTYNGEIEMIYIDREAIDKGNVHNCFYGMSAVYPPKNGLGSEGDKKVVDEYGRRINVPCITFETLMERHNIKSFQLLKIDTEGHDYDIFKQVDLIKYGVELIRLEWVNLSKQQQDFTIKKLEENKFVYSIIGQDIVAMKKNLELEIVGFESDNTATEEERNNSKITLVTGLWDIKRSSLSNGWERSFEDHYIPKFIELLKVPCNLIVYGDDNLKNLVFEHRSEENTLFINRSKDWFKENFYDKIQEIRNNPDWYNQSGWLKESTQGSLDMYNPLVMSKPFLLNDARILDKFNSDQLYWIDAGITNTVHPGYFTHDKVLEKITKHIEKINFVAFPYEASVEIHGFNYKSINELAGDEVKLVGRGGFFGGPKNLISEFNDVYYSLLEDTINQGLMGTEESLFSILIYKRPDLFSYSEIKEDGLISTFFENLKNNTLEVKSKLKNKNSLSLDTSKVALYVITYNSPSQFKNLCESFELYDKDYLDKPKKYLLNNSLDRSTDLEYKNLCEKYGFEEIKKDNIGICGGRQFIAEHFDEQKELDFYMFFEDDMFFYNGKEDTCRNGFNRKINNLYSKSLEISNIEGFDFLKLNFTEFFGDNQKQWAWHNLPEHKRKDLFPEKPMKIGNDVNQAPFLKFKNIKSYKNIPYATGEVYYCNWPQIVSRYGNKKMFLDTKWEYPYEQTWMSHIYQETILDKIKTGILLATPTEHNRFEFYPSNDRREN
jgi:FkbM family methyltransferase